MKNFNLKTVVIAVLVAAQSFALAQPSRRPANVLDEAQDSREMSGGKGDQQGADGVKQVRTRDKSAAGHAEGIAPVDIESIIESMDGEKKAPEGLKGEFEQLVWLFNNIARAPKPEELSGVWGGATYARSDTNLAGFEAMEDNPHIPLFIASYGYRTNPVLGKVYQNRGFLINYDSDLYQRRTSSFPFHDLIGLVGTGTRNMMDIGAHSATVKNVAITLNYSASQTSVMGQVVIGRGHVKVLEIGKQKPILIGGVGPTQYSDGNRGYCDSNGKTNLIGFQLFASGRAVDGICGIYVLYNRLDNQ